MMSAIILNHSSSLSPKQLMTRSFNRNASAFNRSHSLLHSFSTDRRQMLLAEQELLSSTSPAHRRFHEVAGGTTAEIAAVACCAPFSIADLLLLAVYKVPTGLCRKALRQKRRRRRLIRKGSFILTPTGHGHMCDCGHCDDMETGFQTGDPVIMAAAMEMDDDMKNLEKEMWDQFYGAGFWRSHSSRALTVGP